MEEVASQLLVLMYQSYYNGESRFDIQAWSKANITEDFGPLDQKKMVDRMVDEGDISRKMGQNYLITSQGINKVEKLGGPLEDKERQRVQMRRRDILQAVADIQAKDAQVQAQYGKVMEVTRLNRNDCAPHIKLAEERGSLMSPTSGFFRLTDMGTYELEALNGLYPRPEEKKPEESTGRVSLASIKFFD